MTSAVVGLSFASWSWCCWLTSLVWPLVVMELVEVIDCLVYGEIHGMWF